jgi:hypothetical protein
MKKTLLLQALLLIFCISNAQICSVSPAVSKNIVTDYLADPTGVASSHKAFQEAAAYIQSVGGNVKLIIPFGTYKVGKQMPSTVAGTTIDNHEVVEVTTNYYGSNVFSIKGVNNVEIVGVASTSGQLPRIRYKDDLRFGTFSTVATGGSIPSNPNQYNIHNPGDWDFGYRLYAAGLGNCIKFDNCNNVKVSNLFLDGNINGQRIGGNWGAATTSNDPPNLRHIEINHTGIHIKNSTCVNISGIASYYFGLDGIYIDNNKNLPANNVTISGSDVASNTRQGLSWVGGNGLHVSGSYFRSNGKIVSVNPTTLNVYITQAPGAGIDVEPSGYNFCKNAVFENIACFENYYTNFAMTGGKDGMYSSNIVVKNSEFSERTANADGSFRELPNVLVAGTHIYNSRFLNCDFYGNVDVEANTNYSQNLIPSCSNRLLFDKCRFSDCYNGTLLKTFRNSLFIARDYKYLEVRNSKFKAINSGLIASRLNRCNEYFSLIDDCKLKLEYDTFECHRNTPFSSEPPTGWNGESISSAYLTDCNLFKNVFRHAPNLGVSFYWGTDYMNVLDNGLPYSNTTTVETLPSLVSCSGATWRESSTRRSTNEPMFNLNYETNIEQSSIEQSSIEQSSRINLSSSLLSEKSILLNYQNSDNIRLVQVQVINSIGQQILTKKINNENQYKLELPGNTPKGIYFVNCSFSNGEQKTIKIGN